MSSAWLLPEHLADVLPAQARRTEELRRSALDVARGYGYELVMPPLLEHLESLLTGAGGELDLQTFKLVDQLSGRTLGVRADSTPQVARIDAHLLNRRGVTRLCYCGPILHTRPASLNATREPLQLGAEIYGHAGLEADLEVQELALDVLGRAGVAGLLIDLADARIVRGLLAGVAVDPAALVQVYRLLAAKDVPALRELTREFPPQARDGLLALTSLYGDVRVLDEARRCLPDRQPIRQALQDLLWLADHLAAREAQLSFDLADLSGYAYYSGTRFGVYAKGASAPLVRGGRYDEVGSVFGRNRPAAGFSVDLKQLVNGLPVASVHPAVRAPWSEDASLRRAIRQLRDAGETVVCVLPGHEQEIQEFDCDRELRSVAGQWVVAPLGA